MDIENILDAVDAIKSQVDGFPEALSTENRIDARVEHLLGCYRAAKAKIEYLKGEFAKLATYVKVQSDDIHRGQRIIGELLMTLDAQNRKRAAEKLLN